jgi:predicted HTH domain antitoxin
LKEPRPEKIANRRQALYTDFAMSLTIQIPDSVLEAMRIPRPERESRIRTDLACALYAGEILAFGKAAELAGMDRLAFGGELGKRNIPRHYDRSCLDEDLSDDHG